MAQPRPTHEVFRQKAPAQVSYDKFVPATTSPAPERPAQPVEEPVPGVDREEELRRDDVEYLERLARAERDDALEELEREKREGERFRRERGAVKRRVDVAEFVKGRSEQPLIGSLGLGHVIKKRRAVGKIVPTEKEDRREKVSETKLEAGSADRAVNEGVSAATLKPVPLVSGYSSSSDDDDDDARDDATEADQRPGDAKDTG